jgi:hypothetical protein
MRKEKLLTKTDYLTWRSRVTELDNERQIDRKRIADVLKEEFCEAKRPYDPACSSNPNRGKSHQNPNSSSTTNATHTFPPKLTPEECKLLQDSDGCFKCRVPYADHRCHDHVTLMDLYEHFLFFSFSSMPTLRDLCPELTHIR